MQRTTNPCQVICMLIAAAVLFVPLTSHAAPSKKFAAISIDMLSGKVLYSYEADATRRPASLTKIMTLYIVFEELRAGRLSKRSSFTASARAAAREPSKLGLKAGQTITVDNAIRALVTKSANDVATTVAENISGSEAKFAQRMTRTARQLGMSRTTFKNASGLPAAGQVTTARDMARLGAAMIRKFPREYAYFGLRSFKYAGRNYRNHNRLLGKYPGVDGIKTGYIRASGYNLVASARRGTRRVVGVILGGRTSGERSEFMIELLNRAFGVAAAGGTARSCSNCGRGTAAADRR